MICCKNIVDVASLFFFLVEYYFRKVRHELKMLLNYFSKKKKKKMLLNYTSQRIESKDINIMKPHHECEKREYHSLYSKST